MNRRGCLGVMVAGAMWSRGASAHADMGPVKPPVPAPDIGLLDHLGESRALRARMLGKFTALQTIFTGCSSVCPIQGAVFAEVQRQMAAAQWRQPVQLMSVSIDALGDTPAALRQWLTRVQAAPQAWVAAVPPKVSEVDTLQRSLAGSTAPAISDLNNHRENVYFFDAEARLRWRSSPLPSVEEVMDVLRNLAG